MKINDYKWKSKLNYQEFDVSAVVGGDLKIHKRIDLAIRYSYGLLAVDDLVGTDDTGNEVGRLKTYNTALQLSLRYNIIYPQ